MDINYQLPQIQRFPGWSEYTRLASLQALAPPPALSNSAMNAVNQQRLNLFKLYLTLQNKNLLLGQAISSLTGQLSNQVSEGIFGTDTELGQAMGNLFSTGINTAGDQVVNNIFKGESLMNGMGQSVGSSLAGAGAGMAANYIGKGISSLGGNSKLSRGLGAGFATGAGTLGGGALSNIINGERAFGDIADSFKAIKTFNQAKKATDFAKGSPEALEALKASRLGTLNLAGLGASIVGTGLQAAFGPSKEYGGTYGNITRGLDTAYDLVQGATGFIPGVGTAVSGFMALNKGLSNVFGSTSGMTRQDAILGSAFMPATVKWLNMAGAKTTDKFRNQSWLNQERTNTFMQNGFGDLGEKFDKARRESGKTYGTFSRHAYNKAQGNLNFANDAFNRILDMADDEETRRIRSEYMTSINNQRYAQDITGGFRPLYRGKEGMKIPEINHNFGQRLLSGAALIDNKQMILSAQNGTKIFATNSRGDSYYVSPSALTSNEVNVTVPETFITANPDDVARGNAQRWWKEHSNVYNEKGLKQVSPEFDLITLSPLLKPVVNRGFRWVFNKAGNLVRVPKLLELFSLNLGSERFINSDGSINVQEALPEIVKGKKFAVEYLNSPVRAEVNTHNKELADRLGFKLFKPFNEAGLRVATPSNLKIVRENSSIGGSVSTDSRNPAADLVTINLYNSDPYFASMHENLHRGYLGNAPKEYFLNETRGTFGDTNRFYDYLKDKLLKPWSERYNLPAADYLDLSAELAVNMFEVGQRMGLKVGQKFPGNLKVLELLEKFKNSGDYKSGVVDHLNLKHPLRIWKALTGTLFSLPLVYGTVNNTIGLKIE